MKTEILENGFPNACLTAPVFAEVEDLSGVLAPPLVSFPTVIDVRQYLLTEEQR